MACLHKKLRYSNTFLLKEGKPNSAIYAPELSIIITCQNCPVQFLAYPPLKLLSISEVSEL